MIKIKLTYFFLLICVVVSAQQRTFSLEEAVEFALENNRTAVNATRDIEIAEKQKWETTAIGLPQIDATVDYQNFLKQQVSLIPAEFFGGNSGEFEEVVFGTKQNVNATATLSQLIFDGSYLVGLQSAKVFLEISKNAKVKTDLAVRTNVISAYGNVLVAEESVKILEKNKATLENNLFETQKTFENGLAEEESVEQLQITLTEIENALNNSIRLRDIAYKLLSLSLGIDVTEKVDLTDQLEDLTIQSLAIELQDDTAFSMEENIDYKIAANDERSKELLVKLEKSRALPSLSGFLNGGYQAYNDEFTFFDKDQEWFGSSLIGLTLNIPIFSSLERTARTQRAKIEYEKSKTDLTEVEQRIKLELANAQSNYEFSVEKYNISKKNLNLAERIERKNQIKFTEGIATSFELRQAQVQLYSSQQDYLQAMLDVINSKVELDNIVYSGDLVPLEE
ncbi:Outer membrane protein TolC [Zhouia amylolytica]|uniref:Outer membrane protein TolC n=1 Tax=Zhouia amylolytica TaxID=376730 RepID=A0A1I6SR02_9FLAO|nr:TolC family protein [Zhouia amylolytica]MCQ0110258.1 TolC family protein [Zhouia amylolytica]SFS79329.1 Outer membrane protein TolC [Zhouia amylolytica]